MFILANQEWIILLVTLLVGPITAIITVWLERRKDQKEKLEDRKHLWLDHHWKELNTYFKDISKFNLTLDKPPRNEIVSDFTIGEYNPEGQLLETALSHYNINVDNFTITNNIEEFKNSHRISIEHIKSGYKEINRILDEILEEETKYLEELNLVLPELYNSIKRLMDCNFKDLTPSISLGQLNCYSIYKIFLGVVKESLRENSNLISEQNVENNIYFIEIKEDDEPSLTMVETDSIIFQEFKQKVWDLLIEGYKGKIKELQTKQSNIIEKEKDWNKKINTIIDAYRTGFTMRGKCEICEYLINEKLLKNIRPVNSND